MDTNTTNDQLFEKFINNELSASEESFLMDLAQQSPELKQDIDSHINLIQGFAELEKEHVKQNMNLWEQQIKTSENIIELRPEQAQKNNSTRSLVYRFVAIASVFAGLIWGLSLYQSQETSEDISITSTTVRQADNNELPSVKPTSSPVSEGLMLLDKKDYRGALAIFDNYLILNVYEKTVYFHKGYAHFMMNDYQKALDAFSLTLNAKEDSIEKQKAMYYSAQIYLKLDKKEEAIKLLKGITSPDVKDNAVDLLKKIQGE